MLKVRLLLLIIINIFIDKIHIFIDIVKLNNKYALNNKYIFITEKSARQPLDRASDWRVGWQIYH